jgi:hypothetical protein
MDGAKLWRFVGTAASLRPVKAAKCPPLLLVYLNFSDDRRAEKQIEETLA